MRKAVLALVCEQPKAEHPRRLNNSFVVRYLGGGKHLKWKTSSLSLSSGPQLVSVAEATGCA